MAEQTTGTMSYIAARSLLHARQAFRKPFPKLTLARMTPVDDSTLSYVVTVEIDGTDYIFRFPLSGSTAALFPREEKVLKKLAGRTAFPIPAVEYSGLTPVFMGYRKIAGIVAKEGLIRDMASVIRTLFSHDMAQFLARLHAQKVEDFAFLKNDLGVRIPSVVKDKLDKIDRQDSSGLARRFAERALAEFDGCGASPIPNVLLHHDFQGKNILCDEKMGGLTGVIDFTHACLGDPHWDFRFLPEFGGDVLGQVLATYRALTQREIDKERVALLRRLELCHSLALAPKGSPRSADLVERIKRYHNPG